MRVEFIRDEEGKKLIVSESEFIRAEKDEDEMDSLLLATEAYAALNDVEFFFSSYEYTAAKCYLEKSGIVVFHICESRYGRRRWGEVYIRNGEKRKDIVYSEDEFGNEIATAPIRVKALPKKSGRTTTKKVRTKENKADV